VIGGRYTLRDPIGNGGMGTVWRGYDELLRRIVAVKEVLLPPGMAQRDRDVLVERTLREARAAAGLTHPSVVRVYDVVTDSDRPWIVMELLDARSLAELVTEDGALPARTVAKIGLAMLGALEAAHAAGVLHRDVKPGNVLICHDGRCVLTDFGVARTPDGSDLTTPGMVLGSPHYISPERAMGAPFGPPSDLFSLGVTLYTAVEGRPPFDKGDALETMHAVVEEPPTPPHRAGPLTPVLYGLLDKDPARRWDAAQTRSMLRGLLAGPLAATGAVTEPTDPHAVLRGPDAPPPPAQAGPAKKVGGRAMLATGETPTSRSGSDRPERAPSGYDPGPPTADQPTMAGTGVPAPRAGFDPAQAHDGRQHAVSFTPGARTVPASALAGPVTTIDPAGQGGYAPGGYDPLAHDPTRLPPGGYGPGGYAPGTAAVGMPGPAPAGETGGSHAARSSLRFKPKPWMIAAAAGAAVLLLIVIIVAVASSGGGSPNNPQAHPRQTGDQPLIPAVQPYHDDRGFSVNLPRDWKKVANATYVDFTEPGDSTRRIRVNVENAGSTSSAFMDVAERNSLKNNRTCAAPYVNVARNQVKLGGHDATELEYTCGDGDHKRHGLWRATVVSGKSYHFYMSVPDSRFEESKAIYEELVRSFKFDRA